MFRVGPVVLFTAGLAGDGVARNTVHLANALTRRGAQAEIVCLEAGPLSAEVRGATLTRLGRPPGPRTLALAAAVPALHRRLRALRPSAVVSMGNHAHLAVWAALRGLPDIPRIYRISNDPAHRGGERIGLGLRQAGLRLIASDASRLVCVSGAIAQQDAFRRARRDRRLDVLPNGVCPVAVRARAAVRIDDPWLREARPFIVAVGRVHPQKNYGALIEALALAHASERPDLRLLILGAAPARRRAPLEARARALGVAESVRFAGEVANPFPYVRAAAAYVLPSLWEGASNSLLEALACGAPVVAARQAGNAPQVLAEGRHGRLADARDPADLARAILAQITPAACVLPGDRVAAFSLDRVAARLCAIVDGVAAEHDEIQTPLEHPGHLSPVSSAAEGGFNGAMT